MLLPSRRLASMAAGLLLVASFFLPGFATLNENLETVARFSPLEYYQTQEAFAGLNREWLFGLLAAAAVFALLAWWRFVRRDIRVGGEGGWRLDQKILGFGSKQ
jgi:ABC-2 type transport system permease protein